MKVLVTGAAGFLGQSLVAAVRQRGHAVRAIVRSGSLDAFSSDPAVEVFQADLRTARNLTDAFEGCDAVIHAAAAMGLDDFSTFSFTVIATERLLEAMARSACRRLTLVSSFSVYDTTAASACITETSPTAEASMYERGGYAAAKMWQERLCRRAAQQHGIALTILRPGFIWGPGHDDLACIGQSVGPRRIVFGSRRLPLTYVENCADAIVAATLSPRAIGEVYNVVDDDACTSWRYAGYQVQQARAAGRRARRLWIPYWSMKLKVLTVDAVSRLLFRGSGQLPSMFTPVRFDSRFKPFRYSNAKLRDELAWVPPVAFDEAVRRTFAAEAQQPVRAA